MQLIFREINLNQQIGHFQDITTTSEPVVESDEDDDVIPDGFEEAISDEGGWVDINSIDTPPLTLKEIHKFFLCNGDYGRNKYKQASLLNENIVFSTRTRCKEYHCIEYIHVSVPPNDMCGPGITSDYLSHPMICVAMWN